MTLKGAQTWSHIYVSEAVTSNQNVTIFSYKSYAAHSRFFRFTALAMGYVQFSFEHNPGLKSSEIQIVGGTHSSV